MTHPSRRMWGLGAERMKPADWPAEWGAYAAANEACRREYDRGKFNMFPPRHYQCVETVWDIYAAAAQGRPRKRVSPGKVA